MNDHVLRCFPRDRRAGSIRGAAEALHVAPFAISRQIAELEAALGMALLDRLPRGLVPTEAGRAAAEQAADAVGRRAMVPVKELGASRGSPGR